MQTDTITFSFEGKRMSGFLDMPTQKKASALIVFVPGYGNTNAAKGDGFGNGFHRLRTHFAERGITCLFWDKAGCGKSEGVFDPNQPVGNEASEVIAAIAEVKSRHIPGAETVGLWGISRAGWICPLVITQYPIAVWISVSGTDGEENYGYLLEKNFVVEGRTKSQAKKLENEWLKGIEIARKGGTFEENLKATEDLRRDSFYIYLNGSSVPTKEGYIEWQAKLKEITFDDKTGLQIYIPAFDKMLSKINCPVLAIFGDKDCNVDWKKTLALYKRTIGKNPAASLTTKVLPNCDHGMLQCKTGGIREDLSNAVMPDAYFDTMFSWLKEKGFGS
jgi:hypothetical protein